jgi:predicted nucleic acid-binding protein
MCDFITKQKQAQSQCLHPAAFVRIRRALIEACGVARRRDRCGPEETAASKVRAMILADASLVALAEARRLRDIFTLDHADFTVYRLHRRRTFRLWPRVL